MDNNCTDRSAPILITGGGRRLGLYNALRLAELGYPVIVSYRTRHEAVDELEHQGVRVIHADFSAPAGIQRFIETLHDITPQLRAIVHNASAWVDDELLAGRPEAFAELVNVHMFAPYLINTECADLLLSQAQGRPRDIVHMTDFAVQKGSAKRAAYIATKAGLESMTRSFGKRFAPHIKVNAIAPALIKFNEEDDEAYRETALRKSVMRLEPGEEVVWQALLFILENRYLTGTVIPMDGGRHLV